MPPLSGARLAILRSRIDGIVRTMSNAVLRAGRSGVLNRAKDLSCAIVTPDCRLLSAADSLPIHVLSGPDLMARTMHEYHPQLRRGDAFLHNSPYHGCSHAADHTIIMPVIDESGTHRFTVLVKAHQADIGDSAPTTYFAGARDVYEEGALIFPAVKVMSDYEVNQDIVRMCRSRIRVPDQWYGDFLAMVGAARTGEKDLLALGAELGWETLAAFSDQWISYGETRVDAAIRALPGGTASGSSRHDPMPGTPADGVEVRATVTVDPAEGRIVVDLTDNIDVMPCGLNVSEACARTAAMIGIFNGLDHEIPKNAGSFSRIEVRLRAGSTVADRVVAAVQLAMGSICADAAVAEVGAVNPPHKGVISGRDPLHGGDYINQLFLGSTGGPASAHADAWLTFSHAGNAGLCFIDSVEMAEMHHPIRINRRNLLIDTEGAGEHTGAPSLGVELGPRVSEMRIAYVSDGVVNGPQGICGGGFGEPRHRDPDKVRTAVRDGLISTDRAASVYGVTMDQATKTTSTERARS
jgi:N-methylhydantoinase B